MDNQVDPCERGRLFPCEGEDEVVKLYVSCLFISEYGQLEPFALEVDGNLILSHVSHITCFPPKMTYFNVVCVSSLFRGNIGV